MLLIRKLLGGLIGKFVVLPIFFEKEKDIFLCGFAIQVFGQCDVGVFIS